MLVLEPATWSCSLRSVSQSVRPQTAVADVKWERSVNWSGMPALREIEHKPTEFASGPDDVVISNDEMSPLPRSVSCCAKSPVVEFLQDHVPSWDESSDLMSLGMDSLDLVQMRNTFNRKFKTKVPMDVFMSPTQTLLEIVGRLESEIPDLICAASRSIPAVPGFKMDTEKSLVVEFLQDHVPSWDESSDLMSLGMDSLDLVQMRNTFNRKFKTKVPMDAFMSPTQTLLEIVGRLESEIPNRRGPTTTSSSPPLEPAGLLKPAWWSLLGEGKVSERMALAARKHKSHEEVDLAAGQERILTVRTQGMNGSELRASTRVSNSMLLASVR